MLLSPLRDWGTPNVASGIEGRQFTGEAFANWKSMLSKIKFGGPNVTKKPCLRRRVLKSSTGSSQTHSLALAAAEADPQPGSLPADGSQPQVVERLPRHAAARYRGSSAAFLLAIGCRRGGRWRRYQARGAWRPRQRAGAGRRCVGRHAGQWRRAARRAEDFVDDRQQRRQG